MYEGGGGYTDPWVQSYKEGNMLLVRKEIEIWELSDVDHNGESLTSPNMVFQAVKGEFCPLSESMHFLAVDSQNKIMKKFLICKGGYNTVYCTPSDIFRPLMIMGGRKFILTHNHPSKDVTPSEEDILFTKKVSKGADLLGLQFLDHLVYSDEQFYSFKANGLI